MTKTAPIGFMAWRAVYSAQSLPQRIFCAAGFSTANVGEIAGRLLRERSQL